MALLESYVAQPPPLYETDKGAIRVQGTRVSLDSVIYCYNSGKTPESIVQSFNTLKLRDVYVIIVFYLDNREAVNAYIKQRQVEADELRREIEAQRPPGESLQAKLAARKAEAQKAEMERQA